ncbi:hypothetical protein [Mesorhizobium loti]|uniref:hypothetical protein n=1 Tax=Rhizobium loti TaxID=381 RepID=UPI000AA2D458|nr:hypothetical protein [Mesorhizobium loti]
MLSTLPQAHATFLNRIRDAVASDVRFRALLIGGSYVHGGLDEHSDLDFDIVVEDNCYADVLSTRKDFAEALPGFLNAFTGEHVGEPRLLICLYGPPLLHIGGSSPPNERAFFCWYRARIPAGLNGRPLTRAAARRIL